jgi:FixJ family two-component response regulator
MTTVHVVDDDDAFRIAIMRLLKVAGCPVRGYASAGEFLISYATDGPGCLLLDISMPGPSGLELQEALAERNLSIPVVFLSAHADVPSSVRAMKAGAIDVLVKPVDPDVLLQVVRAALARDAARRAAEARRQDLATRYQALRPREREVLAGVIAGKLNKQIAADIGVSERTVKGHRAQMLVKMHASSVADLTRAASELGLVPESRSRERRPR